MGPWEKDTDEAFWVGRGFRTAAAVKEIVGSGEGGEPDADPNHTLDEGVGVGREFMVGLGHGPPMAIIGGHPADADDSQWEGHFPAEGVDPGPEGA